MQHSVAIKNVYICMSIYTTSTFCTALLGLAKSRYSIYGHTYIYTWEHKLQKNLIFKNAHSPPLIILSICCQFAVNLLSICCQFAVNLLSICCQCAVNLLSICCRFAVKLLSNCCRFAVNLLSIC